MAKCVILRKVLPHIDFDFGNMSHKSWASVYCCVVSPLFLTTVHKCLEMEETSCWTFGRGCSLFSSFIGAPVGERSGLPCLVIDAVCSLTLSWWNMQGLLWKRQHLDGMCLSRLMLPFLSHLLMAALSAATCYVTKTGFLKITMYTVLKWQSSDLSPVERLWYVV